MFSSYMRASVRAADSYVVQVDEVAGRRAVVLARDIDLADHVACSRARMAVDAEVLSVEEELRRVGRRIDLHDQAVPHTAALKRAGRRDRAGPADPAPGGRARAIPPGQVVAGRVVYPHVPHG